MIDGNLTEDQFRFRKKIGTRENILCLRSIVMKSQRMISFFWDYLMSKMFGILPADLHNLKQKISYEIDAIPPAMLHDVGGIVLNEVHQCINLDGRRLSRVTLGSNSFIKFLNNCKHFYFGSHCFESNLLYCGRVVYI